MTKSTCAFLVHVSYLVYENNLGFPSKGEKAVAKPSPWQNVFHEGAKRPKETLKESSLYQCSVAPLAPPPSRCPYLRLHAIANGGACTMYFHPHALECRLHALRGREETWPHAHYPLCKRRLSLRRMRGRSRSVFVNQLGQAAEVMVNLPEKNCRECPCTSKV